MTKMTKTFLVKACKVLLAVMALSLAFTSRITAVRLNVSVHKQVGCSWGRNDAQGLTRRTQHGRHVVDDSLKYILVHWIQIVLIKISLKCFAKGCNCSAGNDSALCRVQDFI